MPDGAVLERIDRLNASLRSVMAELAELRAEVAMSVTAASAPARCHVIRQLPNPIIATKTPNPSCANRPRRPIHRRPLGFRQRPFFDQHYTRPAPRAKLHAIRLPRDEKASSSLAPKPANLSALLTEQIPHLHPFLI